jgi:hypothetical protein
MNKILLGSSILALFICASITVSSNSLIEEDSAYVVELVGTYDVITDSIDANNEFNAESTGTMKITEQTGGTFRGHFTWQESEDRDRFTGVVHGNQISFAHCDSASFGTVQRKLDGRLVIEALNAGRDSDYSNYWSSILIATKRE